MLLRPHHLFCVRFYRGHGYSDAFCARMAEVITLLNAGDTATLTTGGDVLCEACPHFFGDGTQKRCRTEEKVRRFDAAALRLLRKMPGDTLTLREALTLEDALVFTPERFDEICPDCEWRGICADLAASLPDDGNT